jgi:tryptophanyl-tRNA synthetase
VEESVATVPGIDGAKMSKSYGNTIEIFMEEKALQKRCNKIVPDSTPLGEPLAPERCNVYALASLFLDEGQKAELAERYRSGDFGYGHFKKELKELIWEHFAEAREKRRHYLDHPDEVYAILEEGAKKARALADEKMNIVRDAVGIL